MPKITLTLAMNPYDRVLPLIHGEVPIEGVELEYVGFPGGVDVFHDQLKFNRYDLSEMSVSSFIKVRQQGWPYRMLPVLHNRNFYYTQILVRRASGIRQDHPEDLIGKRVGVADYQQSAALWMPRVQAFERSKKLALERLHKQAPSLVAFASAALARQRAVMGDDPYPYGLRANARAIDMIQTFSAEQGLTPRKQAWSEIFPEEVPAMEDVTATEDVLGVTDGRVAVA